MPSRQNRTASPRFRCQADRTLYAAVRPGGTPPAQVVPRRGAPCHCGRLRLKIGKSSAMPMPPTTIPMTAIISGSIRLVAVLIAISTS